VAYLSLLLVHVLVFVLVSERNFLYNRLALFIPKPDSEYGSDTKSYFALVTEVTGISPGGGGLRRPVRRAENLTIFVCRFSRNSGSLNLL
jgi:hypothetical protein